MKSAQKIMKGKASIKKMMDGQLPKEQSDAIWAGAIERLAYILARYEVLPKGVRPHTDNYIFPSAAIYLSAKEVLGQEAAFKLVEDAAILNSRKAGVMLEKLMGVPGMPGLFVAIWDPMTKHAFGRKNGFTNVFYPKKKGEFRMDIIACPYCRYLGELGCPEITKIFCGNDNRVYGNLPGVVFERTGTLGTGADRCDFCIRKA